MFKDTSSTDLFIIPMDTNIESLNLANNLRNFGYNVEVEMNFKKLKKSLDYANKEKIQYVIILGENEIKTNSIIIKDMFNNNNFELELNNLAKITNII